MPKQYFFQSLSRDEFIGQSMVPASVRKALKPSVPDGFDAHAHVRLLGTLKAAGQRPKATTPERYSELIEQLQGRPDRPDGPALNTAPEVD